MANRAAIEQEDGHLESVLPREVGVGIQVQDLHRGNGACPLELGERLQHVLAESAALATQDHEARRKLGHRDPAAICGAEPERDPGPGSWSTTGTWPLPGWR